MSSTRWQRANTEIWILYEQWTVAINQKSSVKPLPSRIPAARDRVFVAVETTFWHTSSGLSRQAIKTSKFVAGARQVSVYLQMLSSTWSAWGLGSWCGLVDSATAQLWSCGLALGDCRVQPHTYQRILESGHQPLPAWNPLPISVCQNGSWLANFTCSPVHPLKSRGILFACS